MLGSWLQLASVSLSSYAVGNNIIVILHCRWAVAEQVMSGHPVRKNNDDKINLSIAVRDAHANTWLLLLDVSVARRKIILR